MPFNDVCGDIIAHDIIFFLKVTDSNTDHLDRLNMIISLTVTGISNIAIAKTGSHLLVYDWYICNLPVLILPVEVKVMQISTEYLVKFSR